LLEKIKTIEQEVNEKVLGPIENVRFMQSFFNDKILTIPQETHLKKF
jgi:hypothetical protein